MATLSNLDKILQHIGSLINPQEDIDPEYRVWQDQYGIFLSIYQYIRGHLS